MGKGSFWLPEQASTLAPEIDSLFYFVTWVSVVLFVLVVGAMLYLAYRYRRRSPEDRPTLVHENPIVEISWVVIPTILVLIVFTWGFKGYVKQAVAPPNAYEIQAVAQQWNWLFEYPNGTQTDTLYVPVDRPVRVNMSSVDVLHSFYIPAFRVKHDVLPNRYTSVWFEATKPGMYEIFCTEYCGRDHSRMNKYVKAVSQQEFNDWLETGGAADDLPLPEYGEILYTQQGCNSCHSIDGSRKVGPTFKGLYGMENRALADGSTVTADDNYLRESILNPNAKVAEGYQQGVMPSAYAELTERQLSALIAYIETLE
jgi:cytochrome c oxidase subunit 2